MALKRGSQKKKSWVLVGLKGGGGHQKFPSRMPKPVFLSSEEVQIFPGNWHASGLPTIPLKCKNA